MCWGSWTGSRGEIKRCAYVWQPKAGRGGGDIRGREVATGSPLAFQDTGTLGHCDAQPKVGGRHGSLRLRRRGPSSCEALLDPRNDQGALRAGVLSGDGRHGVVADGGGHDHRDAGLRVSGPVSCLVGAVRGTHGGPCQLACFAERPQSSSWS